jgi:transposase-like protein
VDGAHLTGKYKCVLLSASSLDADGKLLILAQTVVPKETTQSWNFFFHHFKQAGLGNNISFIISDRDKGLINAVSKVFPKIPHSKCLRHLSENYKKKFGQDYTIILKQMAMSYTPSDHVMMVLKV